MSGFYPVAVGLFLISCSSGFIPQILWQWVYSPNPVAASLFLRSCGSGCIPQILWQRVYSSASVAAGFVHLVLPLHASLAATTLLELQGVVLGFMKIIQREKGWPAMSNSHRAFVYLNHGIVQRFLNFSSLRT